MTSRTLLRRLVIASALLIPAGLVSSCESAPASEAEPESALFFPYPPDPPRVQFLTWVTGAQEMEEKESAFDTFVLGGEAKALPKLGKPFGLAARDGVLYVCDTLDGSVARFDFKNRKYSVFGQEGGHLKKPINIAIDELGFKFLADAVKNEVVVFGPDDAFVTSHRVPAPCRVVDLGLWGNELYVLDNDSTPQIVVLDRTNGNVLRTFGGRGNEPGQFNAPAGIAVGPDGAVYVSDAVSCRIQKLDRQGKPLWSKGEQGYHVGQFGRPRGIRTAPDGVVYVADAATEIVQLWNDAGQPLMHIGGPGNLPGAMVLPSNVAVDASSLPYFRDHIHKDFQAEYLVFVASQYGRRLINVYAFGSFPEGYKLPESQWRTIPVIPPPTDTQGPGRQHLAPEPAAPPASSAEATPAGREPR